MPLEYFNVSNSRELLKSADFQKKELIKCFMAPCINCGEFKLKNELRNGQCSKCTLSPEIRLYRRKKSPNFIHSK